MRSAWRNPAAGSLLLALCAAAGGCIELSGSGRAAWNVSDPWWSSPQLQPLYGAGPTPMQARQTPPAPFRTQRPISPQPESSEPRPPRISPRRPEAEPGEGPLLPPPESLPAAEPPSAEGLTLDVDAPERTQIGSAARFQVTVRNTGRQPADAVAVLCEFDPGLSFSRRGERKVRQSLGRMYPGEEKQLALSLSPTAAGTHCARFRVQTGEIEAASRTACIEAVPRRLELEIVGPPERTVGGRAEFTFKLANTSAEVLTGLTATARFDAALVPREASAGAETRPGAMTWRVGELAAGEGVQFQVEFDCRVAAETACLTLEVSGGGLSAERVEKCLRVAAGRGRLDLRAADTADPVAVGDEFEYEIAVRSRDVEPLRDVRLTAEVPPIVRVVSTEVRRGEQTLPVTADVDGSKVRFSAVATLATDEVLTYHIRVKALLPGDGAFRARATDAAGDPPTETVEATTVNR